MLPGVRNRRPLGVMLMTVAAAAFVVGCGGDDDDPAVATAGQTATTAPATTATATAASPSATATAVDQGDGLLGTYSGVATTAKPPDFEALAGATASFGMIENAAYRIEVPDDWNGDLVMYAHGFAGFGTEVEVDSPPRALREYFIANGFAWAASSFSENGYVPGIGADDTLALKRHFEQEFGEPGRTFIVGQSMGGNVVALALEQQAEEYDGGLGLCPAIGGIEQIDYLAAWTGAAEFISGLDFPIGEPGGNAGAIVLQELPKALGTPEAPTAKGEQFASAIKNLTGGTRPFFQEGFNQQYIANFGLVLVDPERKLLVNRAATNEDTVYQVDAGLGLTSEELNAGVTRFAADPEARNAENHPDAVPTTGKISDPLITLHNTGDLFVPITLELSYREKVDAAGAGDLLAQRAIRAGGHCRFSDQELTAAFADLVAWVTDGTTAAGEVLDQDLMDNGLEFTVPLRPGDPGDTD